MAEHEDIFASTTYLLTKSVVAANPTLPERLIKAHAEAIKRFYEDKAFAITAYRAYLMDAPEDVERIYDRYATTNGFERIPYVLAGAIQAVIAQQADPQLATLLREYDYHQVVDNSVVDRLVDQGFFTSLYGEEIAAEQERKKQLAFR
jgi:hypothetical protein